MLVFTLCRPTLSIVLLSGESFVENTKDNGSNTITKDSKDAAKGSKGRVKDSKTNSATSSAYSSCPGTSSLHTSLTSSPGPAPGPANGHGRSQPIIKKFLSK